MMRAQKVKVLKMPTVHMLEKHQPKLTSESSDKETSSGADESQATTSNSCQQTDLDQYPEPRQELQDMKSFYTQEQNI